MLVTVLMWFTYHKSYSMQCNLAVLYIKCHDYYSIHQYQPGNCSFKNERQAIFELYNTMAVRLGLQWQKMRKKLVGTERSIIKMWDHTSTSILMTTFYMNCVKKN